MNEDYKRTLNLPETNFEMRAGLAQKEPRLLARWQQEDLYGAIQRARADGPLFAFHDGPPYANGALHHGHILNKILKDIVIKDRTMSGFRVPYVPGWDCHGLPIEVQVDKELGSRKAALSKAEIHAACRAYAERFVVIQRDAFRRLGVLGRWDDPYRTMAYAYEAATVRELGRFIDSGLVYKGLRVINWCIVHQTALAEAEVEYEDHRSPSAYVAFPLINPDELAGLTGDADLVIWTTTPWTLPANLAITVHPDYEYIAYPVRGKLRIIAKALAPAFLAAIGEASFDPAQVAGQWFGKALGSLRYRHVFLPRESPVLLGEHVTLDAGTGCVHTAPGHGADDFEIGRKNNLQILSPVDGRGMLSADAGPFAGMAVFNANAEIMAYLHQHGTLLNQPDDTITHRYPHCWRCHKPIILRATEQWFVAMDKPYADGGTLRERALAALGDVRWIPPWGEDRIRGMLASRPDWCLSRQRTWGVPIPVAYCQQCSTPFVSSAAMNKVAQRIEQEGAAVWFELPISELLGPLQCETCGCVEFRKETDILDVWFDSGVSYAAVIEREGLGQTSGPPVDLYLEGSDQHRGWFHSSLLCSLATRCRPPYRAVLTHGFVVDGAGKKISKSKGNFIDPFKAIEKDGAELLRLWVAGEDYRDDVRLSQEILTRLSDSYRKVRNTLRYLLGNINDFDPQHHWRGVDELEPLDVYALALLAKATTRVRKAYETYAFHQAVQTLVEFCSIDLSAFYLDVLKDRVYAAGKDSRERRAAQTTLYIMARDLQRLLAPIFCFTAEEAWSYLRRLPGDPESVHLTLYPNMHEPPQVEAMWEGVRRRAADLESRFGSARETRKLVNAALEAARRSKKVGASMEAMVILHGEWKDLQDWEDKSLADLFIVSKVERRNHTGNIDIEVLRAPGTKCARCWLYREEVGSLTDHPTLCKRCVEAI